MKIKKTFLGMAAAASLLCFASMQDAARAEGSMGVSKDMLQSDSLIIKVAHFKNLNPTPVADALHRALSAEFGPILATATLRRASDHSGVAIDRMSIADARSMLPGVVDSLRAYRQGRQLDELRELLARAIDASAGVP